MIYVQKHLVCPRMFRLDLCHNMHRVSGGKLTQNIMVQKILNDFISIKRILDQQKTNLKNTLFKVLNDIFVTSCTS